MTGAQLKTWIRVARRLDDAGLRCLVHDAPALKPLVHRLVHLGGQIDVDRLATRFHAAKLTRRRAGVAYFDALLFLDRACRLPRASLRPLLNTNATRDVNAPSRN